MKWIGVVCGVVAFCAMSVGRCAEPPTATRGADAPSTGEKADELQATQVELLFSAEADAAAKATALQHVVKRALAGDGSAAFYLGVLFRSGPVHPSHATERNAVSARHWLEKCIDSARCPTLALASLAELELEQGNDKAAMQWAQAWTVVEAEAKKKGQAGETASGNAGSDAYAAFLLERCFQRLDRDKRDALAAQWFDELRASKGRQLARMLDGRLKGNAGEEKNWADFFVRKSHSASATRERREPALGLFLLRAAPQGGRAEQVTLIEGLPKPVRMSDFSGILGRFESRPYTPAEAGQKRYALIPVQYADPRYQIAPMTDK